MAASTPIGMASTAVTSSIISDPTTAPSTPACSGSVESERVRKPKLKPEVTAPEAFSLSIQSSCWLSSLRSSSGVARLIWPLK